MSLLVEKHNWEPSFPNEIWIVDKRKGEEFNIYIKKSEVEIEFIWDYGYGGRGSERMIIPSEMLKSLLNEQHI